MRCARLKSEYADNGDLKDGIKVAVMIGMIPKDLQEMVFQMGNKCSNSVGGRGARNSQPASRR